MQMCSFFLFMIALVNNLAQRCAYALAYINDVSVTSCRVTGTGYRRGSDQGRSHDASRMYVILGETDLLHLAGRLRFLLLLLLLLLRRLLFPHIFPLRALSIYCTSRLYATWSCVCSHRMLFSFTPSLSLISSIHRCFSLTLFLIPCTS